MFKVYCIVVIEVTETIGQSMPFAFSIVWHFLVGHCMPKRLQRFLQFSLTQEFPSFRPGDADEVVLVITLQKPQQPQQHLGISRASDFVQDITP